MRTVFLMLPLLAMFAGCKPETQAPPVGAVAEKIVQPAATNTVQPLKTDDKKAEDESYVYSQQGRRDPFLSIIETTKRERVSDKKKKGGSPAEIYDLAEIRLIAIAKDNRRYYAMVQFPDMKYFTITEGTKLGIYGGKVINIKPEGVLIREHVKNYKGEIKPKDTILKLRKEEE